MNRSVVGFEEIDETQVEVVGGKGANLGELLRIDGIEVPAGFCVTTTAFRRTIAEAPVVHDRIDRLSRLAPEDRAAIGALSAEIRQVIEEIAIPDDLTSAIDRQIARLGDQATYAVRSSATAEDLPTASFAGQHDTYLNLAGLPAILTRISRCWASLFTERAVTYRLRNGIDHQKISMAIVVQRMVFPEAAGILFTADPTTGNRRVSSIEASLGLGEALVSGLVTADVFRVRNGEIVDRTIATKQHASRATPTGRTDYQAVEPDQQDKPALTDGQVLRLDQLGRRIEAHFGRPQDIEWCLVGDDFQFVQSRPITTLFPIPVRDEGENHVYISVGHQQMMTDPIKPLGLSIWQLTAGRPMYDAGGRLFVDVTRDLASPASRARLLDLAKSDPLIGDALETILERGNFLPLLPDASPGGAMPLGRLVPIETDPTVVSDLIERWQTSIAALKHEIRAKAGTALLDFIVADIEELRRLLFDPQSHRAIMAGIEASWWLNERVETWLGEKNAADTLTRSVPQNVTSEMGLALLDVADVIRIYPEVVALLQAVRDDGFLDEIVQVSGGEEARAAIEGWLATYGMRCVGEIDITRPRWSERPATLLPLILGNVKTFEAGAGKSRFEQGQQEAQNKERELLARLRSLPDGEERAKETEQMIRRVRTFIGYREYPKYGMIGRYFVYKQALMEEAGRLVQAGVLGEKEDIFYLTFHELREVVVTNEARDQLIRERKEAFRWYQTLTPPRVLTSDGEVISGTYRRDDFPAGALVGLAVSAGTVEGRARVIHDLAEADLEPGDILVTAYTDPSWTPLFVAIRGLVTEVGGLLTHGSVIAREYGLPAVVGVKQATRLIKDGQRIRVQGTDGYVEILP
ncbi:MAG: rifamycin-inactivating phosphotransferase [Dehalococcoidia bacterium]